MKKSALLLVAVLAALAFPSLAENQPSSHPYVPRLADTMGATQLRHFKLWYAGKEKNWRLAKYELEQIKNSFQDAMIYYPGLPVADMSTMAKPAAAIDEAIAAKDANRFARAFGGLTAACNSCHRSQGLGFIVIKVPSSSPFSNQSFGPQ